MTWLSGTRPKKIGVVQGRLAGCPSSPNCVSSQTDPQLDAWHAIEPLRYQNTRALAINKLRRIIENYPRAKLIEAREDYLYAEFTSALMGFVDDVEFYFPSDDKIVHVRSASRLGYRDYGANRERIEAIRAQFE